MGNGWLDEAESFSLAYFGAERLPPLNPAFTPPIIGA
jgi:hypothetical protein